MSDCCYRTAHCNSVLAEEELQFILGGYIWLDMHGANVKCRQNDGYGVFIGEIALNSFNKMKKKNSRIYTEYEENGEKHSMHTIYTDSLRTYIGRST